MRYVRVFLSHASQDKPLVQAVADALARRGVIAWLDIHELCPGLDLSHALAEAVREHTLIAVFLSREALQSHWVDDELAVALEQEDRAAKSQQPRPVIPVFLDEPRELIKDHPRLRARWMHPDGNRVDRLGAWAPDTGSSLEARAQKIADELARTIYQRMGTAAANDVALILDQRGHGNRTGVPEHVPKNLADFDIPALVFRPDLGPRQRGEVVRGRAWEQLSRDLVHALSEALGPRRPTPRKIRILGASQLSLAFLVGQQLDRTHGAALYCYDRDGASLMIDLARHSVPLTGGTPHCARMHPGLAALPQLEAGVRPATLVLMVLKDDHGYLQQAAQYLHARDEPQPAAWIPHPPVIQSADEIVTLARDIKAFVDQTGARTVEIITSLPFHALPLLGALLSPHVFGNIIFLERDRDAVQDSDEYVALPLP